MRRWVAALALAALGCGGGVSPVVDRGPGIIAGASAGDRAAFRDGYARFNETERALDGLGPFYNGTSCADCHRDPGVGGSGPQRVRRAGTLLADGGFVAPPGGTMVPSFSIHAAIARPEVPADANVLALRRPLPLFGAGLIEAIDDATLVALAEAQKPYGIHGHVAWVSEPGASAPRVGRFGWKDDHATLRAMCGQAYRDEMGITNEMYPDELAPNGDPALLDTLDTTIDPEAHTGDLDGIVTFVRLLAPPPPASQVGEALFEETGCAVCHVPSLTTGTSDDPAFDRRPVPLYSDLLLHDVGTGDGIPQGAATGAELRTTPLWGLSRRTALLHDGSAASLDEAILRHAGEAAEVTARYQALSEADRAALLAFLGQL